MDQLFTEATAEHPEVTEGILDFYFAAAEFFEYIMNCVDEHYVIYTEHSEKMADFKMKLFCVDPAVKSAGMLGQRQSARCFFPQLCCRSNITAGC